MDKINIKICGITRLEDALCAKESGAWAIGYIFVQASKRYIEPQQAGIISAKIQDIQRVGIFVNSSVDEIVRIAKLASLTIIQLHGEETPEFCQLVKKQTNLEVIKAIRIKSEVDLQQIVHYKDTVFAVLLDSYSEKEYGGTGETFDWKLAQKAKDICIKIILAGGLKPENIKEAVETVKPFGVDVSSGVESEKGIKDKAKIVELFEIIK